MTSVFSVSRQLRGLGRLQSPLLYSSCILYNLRMVPCEDLSKLPFSHELFSKSAAVVCISLPTTGFKHSNAALSTLSRYFDEADSCKIASVTRAKRSCSGTLPRGRYSCSVLSSRDACVCEFGTMVTTSVEEERVVLLVPGRNKREAPSAVGLCTVVGVVMCRSEGSNLKRERLASGNKTGSSEDKASNPDGDFMGRELEERPHERDWLQRLLWSERVTGSIGDTLVFL